MAAPRKKNPDNASEVQNSGQDLTTLSQFCDFLGALQYERKYQKCARDALKTINCLRFIKINAEFIGYAFKNRTSRDLAVARSIYTHIWNFRDDDFAKGVLRDFSDTSFHLNGYKDDQLQKCLEELQLSVAQIEFAITEVTARGKEAMLEFTQQFQYDELVGCLDARLSKANKYIGNLITATTPHLDELFEKLAQETQTLSESEAYDKALQFFAPYINKSCRFGPSDEEILTWKRVIDYFTETLGYQPPEPLHIIKKSFAAVHSLNAPGVGADMLPITEAHVALFNQLADPNHPPLAAEKKPGDKGYNYTDPIPVTLLPADRKQSLLQNTGSHWIGLLFDTRRCLKDADTSSFASGNSRLSVSQNALTAITIAHDSPLVRLQAMCFQEYFQQCFHSELPIVFISPTDSPRLYSRQERFNDYLRVKSDAKFNAILASEAMQRVVEPFKTQITDEQALLARIRAKHKEADLISKLKDAEFVELMTPAYKNQLLQAALSVNYNQVVNFAIQKGAKLEDDAIRTCLSASNFHPEQLDVDTLTAFNRIFETAQSTFISQAEKKEYRVATFQALSTGVTQASNAVDALETLLWARQQSMFAEHRSTHWFARLGRTHTVVEIDKLIKTSLKQLNQERAKIAVQDSNSNVHGFSQESVQLCSLILAQESKRLQAEGVIEQRSIFYKVPRQKIIQFSQLQENIQRLLKSSARPGHADFGQLLQNMTDLLDMGMLNQTTTTQLNAIRQAWQGLETAPQFELDLF